MATAQKRKTSRKPGARKTARTKRSTSRKAKPARAAKPARRKSPKPKAALRGAPRRRSAARPADQEIREFARRIVDLTLANDDEAMFGLYADDIESSEAGAPPMRGIDSIRTKFAGWRNMVTQASFEPRRVLVDGNTIVIEWLGNVTLAGSGKQAELHEIALHEIRDGKIVREAFFYNPAALAP